MDDGASHLQHDREHTGRDNRDEILLPAYSLLLNGNVNSVRRIGALKSLRTMLPHTVENSIGMSITPVTYMSEKV